MNTYTNEQLVANGAVLWSKGEKVRVYFNTREIVAACFNFAIVDSVSGMIPAGFNGMVRGGKTKSYFENGVLFTDCNDVKQACQMSKIKVVRI